MMNYYQQSELARLQYEAKLAEAEHARRFAHLRQPIFQWPAWLRRVGQQRWGWFAPQQPVVADGVAAVRQQPC